MRPLTSGKLKPLPRGCGAPQGSDRHGTVEGTAHHRTGRHRPRAVLRDAAGRHGRRRGAHRPHRSQWPGRADGQALRHQRPQPPLGGAGPEVARRPRRGAAADRRRRHPDRGFPPRRGRAAGAGPGRLPCDQSGPGLRPHDRLRPERADVAGRRSRPQLHRTDRRAACHRPGRRQAGAAAEPGGRLRRRRAVPGDGPAGRAARAHRNPAAARSWMRRWSTARPRWPRSSTA